MQLAPGKAREAARLISKIPGVKMAHAVTGPFDVIAFAEVSDMEELSDLVLSRVQRVKGVEKTQTAVVVTSSGEDRRGSLRHNPPSRKRKA